MDQTTTYKIMVQIKYGLWIKLQHTKQWSKLNMDCGSNYNIQNNGQNYILMVNQTITYKIMAQIKFQWRSPIYIVNAFQKNIRSVGQDRYYHYYL